MSPDAPHSPGVTRVRENPRLANTLMILALISSFTACVLLLWDHDATRAEPRETTARGPLTAAELATVEIFRKASPAVVHIQIPGRVDLRRMRQIPEGSGTGFLWDDQGHIVTNFHVVNGIREVLVIFSDNQAIRARVVGAAPSRDIAVLRLVDSRDGVHPLPLGTSRDLQVGQKVYAIGNPFGYDQTLTDGIVSALGREITSLARTKIWDVIQTNAAINPGNSGGPLLDSAGRVIGMNTAIFSPSGASSGIGFAIPVDSLARVVPDLIGYGRFNRPVFGFKPADSRVREHLGITGVLVEDVTPGSAAARAGFKPTYVSRGGKILLGDVIVAIDGKDVKNRVDLDRVMDSYRVGDTVTVTLERDGKRRQETVELQSVDDN